VLYFCFDFVLNKIALSNINSVMAKARKEGKSKRNRINLVKKLKIINKNQELIKQYSENL
jgi:hypothetical protein